MINLLNYGRLTGAVELGLSCHLQVHWQVLVSRDSPRLGLVSEPLRRRASLDEYIKIVALSIVYVAKDNLKSKAVVIIVPDKYGDNYPLLTYVLLLTLIVA